MPGSQSDNTDIENQVDIQSLIDRFQLSIWRYLRVLGCDETLADDLTQDTFVAVLRRPIEYLSDTATSAYLRRVAYHLLIDHRRRSKRTVLTQELDLYDQLWFRWAGGESENEIFEYLKACFDRLTDRAKLSLRMRFAEGASREKIAEALGISPNGAKNLMQRAKTQLKECIESQMNAGQEHP